MEDAGPALLAILEDMTPKIREGLNAGVKETAKEGAKVTRESGGYQNRRPKYRKAIKYRTSIAGPVIEAQIYASGHEYSLTHLLENGHHLWNAPGVMTRAFKHWKVGEDYVDSNLERNILSKIDL